MAPPGGVPGAGDKSRAPCGGVPEDSPTHFPKQRRKATCPGSHGTLPDCEALKLPASTLSPPLEPSPGWPLALHEETEAQRGRVTISSVRISVIFIIMVEPQQPITSE